MTFEEWDACVAAAACQYGQAFIAVVRPTIFDGDVVALDEAGLLRFRVVRGGSWRNESARSVRAAVRVKRHTNVRFDTLGFRVARG